jgi:nicotinamide phosphoribosyltransferase
MTDVQMSTTEVLRSIRFLTGTDSYKLSHWAQYPQGTTKVYSNFTPRYSRVDGLEHVVFFGLQAFLSDWCGSAFDDFLALPEDVAVSAYADRVASIIGPSDDDFDRVRRLHRLGYLPLEFRALPEGSVAPMRVPLLTVENTHPDFYWLTNYIESVLSAALWHPITSATLAWRLRALLNTWAQRTGGSAEAVAWQGHDFSLRGLEGIGPAGSSGAGHLLSFTGTDSLPALDFVDTYYGDPLSTRGGVNGLVGGSVPATEHSVMCAGGDENEEQTFARILNIYPTGIVSVVSDTWDLWKVVTEILPSLHDSITARAGKLVIRPDSGDPTKIIVGDPSAPAGSPQQLGLARLLAAQFGTTTNEKGYQVLDEHVGMIYGDSITYERAEEICSGLERLGFASTNIVLGVGSYTYQYVTRDTLGIAMKATWAEIGGEGHDLYKDPVTDDGGKRSAAGRLAVLTDGSDELRLVERATAQDEERSLLRPVWRDGRFLQTWSFRDIRENLWDSPFGGDS